jgi:hypothetical protein
MDSLTQLRERLARLERHAKDREHRSAYRSMWNGASHC